MEPSRSVVEAPTTRGSALEEKKKVADEEIENLVALDGAFQFEN